MTTLAVACEQIDRMATRIGDAEARASFLERENRNLIDALKSVSERLNECADDRDEARNRLDAFHNALAAAALRRYICSCGAYFAFTADSTIEDYAALNRWLGYHGVCEETA